MTSIGVGKNFPPDNPGLAFKAVTYLMVNGLVLPTISIFMNLLNRTLISGHPNIQRLKPPYILMSNHLTLLDDLFLDPLIFFPNCFKGYKYIPYHAPEENNFYKTPIVSWFMKQAKSIPLIRGRGFNQEGVRKMIQTVTNGGVLHIYPEGTRTRTGDIGRGQDGVGKIVYETGVPVVPMYHRGLERILPIGSGMPTFGKSVRVTIGKPITFNDELKMENKVATWHQITEKIMGEIRKLQDETNNRWGFQPIVVKQRSPRRKPSKSAVTD